MTNEKTYLLSSFLWLIASIIWLINSIFFFNLGNIIALLGNLVVSVIFLLMWYNEKNKSKCKHRRIKKIYTCYQDRYVKCKCEECGEIIYKDI